MVSEQLMPHWHDGNVIVANRAHWQSVHDKLSMELGLESLSPLRWNFYDVNKVWQSGIYSFDNVCKTWMLAPFKVGMDPERYMKERISFIELAFRDRWEALVALNAELPKNISDAAAQESQRLRMVPGLL